MGDDEAPDIFADSVNIAAGNYGVTMTLFRSDPTAGETPGRIVGRIRMAPELAADLIPLLTAAAEAHRKGVAARTKK